MVTLPWLYNWMRDHRHKYCKLFQLDVLGAAHSLNIAQWKNHWFNILNQWLQLACRNVHSSFIYLNLDCCRFGLIECRHLGILGVAVLVICVSPFWCVAVLTWNRLSISHHITICIRSSSRSIKDPGGNTHLQVNNTRLWWSVKFNLFWIAVWSDRWF